ncbi:hypothetical protein GCM10027169_36510 [Gordonia jinhuaensis]|uniref:DUF3558 domain-containing protein n=1 Tax=Gordonia jinhuaensis TaxID=1517702 RepID=A0A916T364_9ACTN|nr:DUF3558 family protein [Gordonia jinhuaensis]GGB29189.1 hypothetical protein GCM10011489_16630 [Gordonia jinhuaensis]
MGAKKWTWIAASIVTVAGLVTGCSSTSGGTAISASSTTVGAQEPSEDDPNNTTSTKDMSTVTASPPAPGKTSPYLDRMINICPRFPDSAVSAAGLDPSLGRFPLDAHTSELLNTCSFNAADPTGQYPSSWSATVSITSQSIDELIHQPTARILQSNIPIGPQTAYTFRSGFADETSCTLAYGTFFGSAMYISKQADYPVDTCAKVTQVARALYPYIPTRPSELSTK